MRKVPLKKTCTVGFRGTVSKMKITKWSFQFTSLPIWMFTLRSMAFLSENNRYKCFLGVKYIFRSCSSLPSHSQRHMWQGSPQISATSTRLILSRHRKQYALQRGHLPTVAAERNRMLLVEGENHSWATKHHQYVFIDMDTVYNGLHHADRGRDGGRGKWLLGNSHIMKNKPKKSEAPGQQM